MKIIGGQWNSREVERFLAGDNVRKALETRGQRIADRAGDGYETSTGDRGRRAHVWVGAVTPDAMRDNARHNTLMRSIDAGR